MRHCTGCWKTYNVKISLGSLYLPVSSLTSSTECEFFVLMDADGTIQVQNELCSSTSLLIFGTQLVVHRADIWLCAQGYFLVGLRRPSGMPTVKPSSATCKISPLYAVLLLPPWFLNFLNQIKRARQVLNNLVPPLILGYCLPMVELSFPVSNRTWGWMNHSKFGYESESCRKVREL